MDIDLSNFRSNKNLLRVLTKNICFSLTVVGFVLPKKKVPFFKYEIPPFFPDMFNYALAVCLSLAFDNILIISHRICMHFSDM